MSCSFMDLITTQILKPKYLSDEDFTRMRNNYEEVCALIDPSKNNEALELLDGYLEMLSGFQELFEERQRLDYAESIGMVGEILAFHNKIERQITEYPDLKELHEKLAIEHVLIYVLDKDFITNNTAFLLRLVEPGMITGSLDS